MTLLAAFAATLSCLTASAALIAFHFTAEAGSSSSVLSFTCDTTTTSICEPGRLDPGDLFEGDFTFDSELTGVQQTTGTTYVDGTGISKAHLSINGGLNFTLGVLGAGLLGLVVLRRKRAA